MSRLIEKLSQTIIERTVEIPANIRAIQVKSPVSMIYCGGSKETTDLLSRMSINLPDQIHTGALPKEH